MKKFLFILFGLAIIGAGFFFNRSQNVEAAFKEGQKFDDWTVNCAKDDKKKRICFLSQQVTTTVKEEKSDKDGKENSSEDKVQVMAFYQIGFFGEDKKLKMIQLLPLGILLEAGTAIVAGEQVFAEAKFSTCFHGGCQAIATIGDKELETMLNNEKVNIRFVGGDGKEIFRPVSPKGLKEGIEALKSSK